MLPDIPSWLTWMLLAATWGAVLWFAMKRSEEPGRLLLKWLMTTLIAGGVWLFAAKVIGFEGTGSYLGNFGAAALLAGAIATGGILIGLIWASAFGEKLAQPLTSLFDDGAVELKPTPLYSTAIARRKQGHPTEAIAEIDRQLARFPNDWPGSLLKADIQALDLTDLKAAEETLEIWLRSPAHDAGHHAVAHTRMADWHLQTDHDLAAARRHLQSIIDGHPGSEAALFAEQRLAHLDFEAQPKAHALRLEPGLGQAIATGVPPPVSPPAPAGEVPGLLQHLKAHPHDIAAHENLVQIYAWEMREANLARSEIETLIQLRSDSPRAVAQCLNLLADVETQLAGDLEAARAALQRILDAYPGSAWAHQAENRLRFLPREMARHQHARIVTARKPAPSS